MERQPAEDDPRRRPPCAAVTVLGTAEQQADEQWQSDRRRQNQIADESRRQRMQPQQQPQQPQQHQPQAWDNCQMQDVSAKQHAMQAAEESRRVAAEAAAERRRETERLERMQRDADQGRLNLAALPPYAPPNAVAVSHITEDGIEIYHSTGGYVINNNGDRCDWRGRPTRPRGVPGAGYVRRQQQLQRNAMTAARAAHAHRFGLPTAPPPKACPLPLPRQQSAPSATGGSSSSGRWEPSAPRGSSSSSSSNTAPPATDRNAACDQYVARFRNLPDVHFPGRR